MERPFVTGKNYIIRDRVPWFKRGSSPHQTAQAMVGARPGDAVLMLGSRDAGLAAAVALVTGLNGRTLVVDRDATAPVRVAIAAEKAGALVDFTEAPVTALPFESGAFDVAVVDVQLASLNEADRRATVAEAFRILRPAGRVIVIERVARGRLFGGGRDMAPALAGDAVQALLQEAGGRAVRQLADVDGAAYFETRRP